VKFYCFRCGNIADKPLLIEGSIECIECARKFLKAHILENWS